MFRVSYRVTYANKKRCEDVLSQKNTFILRMLNHKNSWGKINTAVIGGILSTLLFKLHSAHTAIAKKRKEKDSVDFV